MALSWSWLFVPRSSVDFEKFGRVPCSSFKPGLDEHSQSEYQHWELLFGAIFFSRDGLFAREFVGLKVDTQLLHFFGLLAAECLNLGESVDLSG